MLKFWSEVPAARLRELLADVATWAWVALWVSVASRIHSTISGFAEAGRTISRGGANIQAAGVQVGDSLAGLPLVGEQARDLSAASFKAAGEPFVYVGGELEELLILIALLLTALVLAAALVPWLSRYLPWRARRLGQLRAAHTAIRVRPTGAARSAVDGILAARAVNRLSYEELLAASHDPLGDLAAGRYDRLARAELESVGLRPR
jgi:hypothetical protein